MNSGGGGSGAVAAGIMGMLCMFFFIWLAIMVFYMICGWKVYAKAGKPGWASLVPIYNVIVLLEIVGRPLWWIVLLIVPCVNIVVAIMLAIDLAKSFGKDVVYGLGLAFLGFIFYPMLAFGSAQYQGPAAQQQ